MRRNSGRQLSLTPLVALALGVAVAAGLALLVEGEARTESSPGLVVGVFATFLTSTSIVAAFSIEGRSRWPTPWETLDRAHVLDWFLVALASVVVALVAVAVDNAFLSAFGLSLALVGLALGARGLWGLFALSSDRGRHALIVDLLAGSIRRAPPLPSPEAPDLSEIDTEDHVPAWFSSVETAEAPGGGGVSIELVPGTLRLYADRGDPGAIVRLVDEVHAAAIRALADGDWGGPDQRLARVDRLLGVLRGMFGELVERVAAGRLDGPAALDGLARAGEAAIDVAGRARLSPGEDRQAETEILAARHLAAFCRQAGAAATRAELTAACIGLQQAARWAVDPAPPGMKLPDDHPWRHGLSDAESALVWLWSAAESPSGPYGVGLYALCEILTGSKFLDSYWEGHDVFAEIERRLAGGSGDRVIRASSATLERAGGLARVSLELAAARLAATPGREARRGARGSEREDDDRHVACDLFLAGGGFKPAGRDPVADLAWLLTDRLDGSLWTMVQRQLAGLGEPVVRPPLRPLHLEPAACALAVCLRLTPLERDPGRAGELPLRELAERLPGPLLGRTLALARELTGEEKRSGLNRAETVDALVGVTRFVRKLIPGTPPGRANGRESPPPAAGPVAPAAPAVLTGRRPVDDFERALRLVATTEREIEVDLVQCDVGWLERWADLRSALDAELLAAALRGRARVRRVVVFEIPGDADSRATRFHYRWTDALSTAVGCFQGQLATAEGEASPYRVRQLVLPFAEPRARPPADCAVVREAGAEAPLLGERATFEETWALFEREGRDAARDVNLVDLAGRGGPLGLG